MFTRDNIKNKKNFCNAIVEAIPLPVLVVNADVQILYYNSAASVLLGSEPEVVIRRRAGEVLHCIHSTEALEGCGYSPFCTDCIIRDSVNQSFKGQKVSRKLQKMEMLQKKNVVEIYLLVTTAPLQYGKKPLVMVLLEDVSELRALRQLIPICSRCKKIRDDQDYWHHVEEYLRDQLDVDFTHSICPECARELYPGLTGDKGK